GFRERALSSVGTGRSVALGAALSAALLVLEVRDHLLDLGLVLRLAGLLHQLRRNARRDELPDHACHVRLLLIRLTPPCPSAAAVNHGRHIVSSRPNEHGDEVDAPAVLIFQRPGDWPGAARSASRSV